MIIIRIQGGLGNQLFQYALYVYFKQKGKTVKADVTAYRNGSDRRRLELSKLGIEMEVADRDELHDFYADNQSLMDRVMRYTLGRGKYHKERSYDFNPGILEMEKGYLSGYWQSEKYFKGVAEVIRGTICFQNVDSEQIMLIKQQMSQENAVALHVRIGDYANQQELYGGICTKEYYDTAIAYVSEHVENPVFYVFSDEPEKATELLGNHKYRLITENTEEDSYKDMYLMSCCKHQIIANSTFGWWGAWLNPKKDKIVVTPSKWNNLCKANEICCDGWIMIDT